MDATLTHQRVWLGHDARIIAEHIDGIELEGDARLRPGHPVELCVRSATPPAPVARRAIVITWRVARVESGRPVFQGFCRWQHDG